MNSMQSQGGVQPNRSMRRAIRSAQRAADAGHRVDELPIGRTQIYKLIGEGKLVAKKMGRCTLIMNWGEYVESLPAIPAKIAA